MHVNPFKVMDFLEHVDRITIESPMMYFKRSWVEISKLACIFVIFLIFQTVQIFM